MALLLPLQCPLQHFYRHVGIVGNVLRNDETVDDVRGSRNLDDLQVVLDARLAGVVFGGFPELGDTVAELVAAVHGDGDESLWIQDGLVALQ